MVSLLYSRYDSLSPISNKPATNAGFLLHPVSTVIPKHHNINFNLESISMPDAKRCTCCNTPLVNKRSHSKTCGTNCRSKLYRERQKALKTNVSVKLVFKRSAFNSFKQEAELNGILINELLASKIHNYSSHQTI